MTVGRSKLEDEKEESEVSSPTNTGVPKISTKAMVKSASFRKSDVAIEDIKESASETISFTVKCIGKYVPAPKPRQNRRPQEDDSFDEDVDSFDELDDILEC